MSDNRRHATGIIRISDSLFSYYQQQAYTFSIYYRRLNTDQVFTTECHQECVWHIGGGNFLKHTCTYSRCFTAHNAIGGGKKTLCSTPTYFYELKAIRQSAGSL